MQAGGRRFDPVILHQSPTHSILDMKSEYALAIEPVRGHVNRVHVVLSFFNNLEEVVKRFTKAHLEMGERVGESRVVIVSMYEKLSRDGLEYGATRILNLWRL